ncbi:MAG: hypothetical protein ACLQVL_25835 [Terriglobia bacterium]
MSEASSVRGGAELTQPAVVRLYNNLTQVYRIMRERQKEIDAAFDRVAAQIGFIVTTTLPVRVEVAEEGAVKKVSFDGEALRGTIFEKELSGFLHEFAHKPFSGVPAGTYRFYLIWYDALNLKLRFEWTEPPHLLQAVLASQRAAISASSLVRPEVKEPPHWFDPGIAIAVEEAVVILAIDEVYPELRLAERISAGRLAIRRSGWVGVREMAPVSFSEQLVSNEAELMRRPGWVGVREMVPLSFSEPLVSKEKESDLLAKIRALLGK